MTEVRRSPYFPTHVLTSSASINSVCYSRAGRHLPRMTRTLLDLAPGSEPSTLHGLRGMTARSRVCNVGRSWICDHQDGYIRCFALHVARRRKCEHVDSESGLLLCAATKVRVVCRKGKCGLCGCVHADWSGQGAWRMHCVTPWPVAGTCMDSQM